MFVIYVNGEEAKRTDTFKAACRDVSEMVLDGRRSIPNYYTAEREAFRLYAREWWKARKLKGRSRFGLVDPRGVLVEVVDIEKDLTALSGPPIEPYES